MSKIQSVLISKKAMTQEQADKWIIDHEFKIPVGGADINETYYRYRQIEPKNKYNYRILNIKKDIKFIIAISKKHDNK